MKSYKGVLTSPAVTGNQSVTGLGFQPKVVLFWATRNTAHGFSTATIQQMFGVAVSSTQRWVYVGASDNAVATSNAGRASFNTQCIRMLLDGTPTLDAIADFVSNDTDGFTINWSDTPSTAILVHYLALGGTDITNVYAATSATPGATGNVSYTGPGFQPSFLLACTNIANINNSFTEHNLTLGFASASTAQGAAAIRDHDAVATTDVVSRQVTDRVLCATSSTSTSDVLHAALSSFDATGFTLTWSGTMSSSQAFGYLCIKGGQFKVGSETQGTSTGTKATTGVGFKPAALIGLGWNKAASTALDTTDMRLTVGGADGTRMGHTWLQSVDAVSPSNTAQRSSASKFLGFCTQPSTVNAECDVSTLDTDGFTLNWTTADTTARQFVYAALGPFEGGTTFTQAVTASGTATAAMVRMPGKIATTAATGTAAFVKQVGAIRGATATGTAALVKRGAHSLTASATGTAFIGTTRIVLQAIAAAATGTASMVRQPRKLLTASATGTAALVKSVGKGTAITATGTAALFKRAVTTVAANTTGTAVISSTRNVLQALTAAATGTAGMARSMGKAIAAAGTGTAALVRQPRKTLAASATGVAALSSLRVVLLTITATATGTASMVRRVGKSLLSAATGIASILTPEGRNLPAAVAAAAGVRGALSAAVIAGDRGVLSDAAAGGTRGALTSATAVGTRGNPATPGAGAGRT